MHALPINLSRTEQNRTPDRFRKNRRTGRNSGYLDSTIYHRRINWLITRACARIRIHTRTRRTDGRTGLVYILLGVSIGYSVSENFLPRSRLVMVLLRIVIITASCMYVHRPDDRSDRKENHSAWHRSTELDLTWLDKTYGGRRNSPKPAWKNATPA